MLANWTFLPKINISLKTLQQQPKFLLWLNIINCFAKFYMLTKMITPFTCEKAFTWNKVNRQKSKELNKYLNFTDHHWWKGSTWCEIYEKWRTTASLCQRGSDHISRGNGLASNSTFVWNRTKRPSAWNEGNVYILWKFNIISTVIIEF